MLKRYPGLLTVTLTATATAVFGLSACGKHKANNDQPPATTAPSTTPHAKLPAPTTSAGSVTKPTVSAGAASGSNASGTSTSTATTTASSSSTDDSTDNDGDNTADNGAAGDNSSSSGNGSSGNGSSGNGNSTSGVPYTALDAKLQNYFNAAGVYAVNDSEYYTGTSTMVELGARLFYDKTMSGSGGVSCASCHLTAKGTSDNYSLPPTGYVLAGQRSGALNLKDVLARNVPPLYNLGHKSFATMFWDSRVAATDGGVNGYITPAGDKTPSGLANALAAQALFPLITANEMAGCSAFMNGSHQSQDPTVIWANLVSQIASRQDYQTMLAAAYPEANGSYGIEHLVNAIAAFEATKWRADKSPFDAYLRGNTTALTTQQKLGAAYFYGKGNCGSCHSGPFQTDHGHHATAIPQFGPGEGDGGSHWADYGLGRATGNSWDRYKFKTPSLRNVALTGPWGHDGSFSDLRQFVSHYRNPDAAFDGWDTHQIILDAQLNAGSALGAWNDKGDRDAIKGASELHGVNLSDDELSAIITFLFALTDSSVATNDGTTVIN